MALEVVQLEHEEWDRALQARGGGALFHSAWWYRAWGLDPQVLAVRSAGHCVAGWCRASERRWMGLCFNRRPPLTPVDGPVFCDAGLRHRDAQGFRHQALGALLKAAGKGQTNDVIVRLPDADVLPFIWSGYRCLPRITYTVPVGHDWRGASSAHHRRNLKRGERLLAAGDLELQPDADPCAVWPLLRETARRGGFVFPEEDRCASWWRAVVERGAGRLHLIHSSSGPIAAAVTVRDETRVYYLAGGTSRSGGNLASAASALLMGSMIDGAAAAGLSFDFEGSLLPGVERYLRGWGGVQEHLLRFVGGNDLRGRICAALVAKLLRRRATVCVAQEAR